MAASSWRSWNYGTVTVRPYVGLFMSDRSAIEWPAVLQLSTEAS